MAPTLTPFAKRLITYISLAFGCYVVFQYGLHSAPKDNRSTKYWSSLINDPKLQLRGLIHVLKTYPEQSLPDVEDGALLTPYALGVKEHVTPAQWVSAIRRSEKETALTVFSKVSSYRPSMRLHPLTISDGRCRHIARTSSTPLGWLTTDLFFALFQLFKGGESTARTLRHPSETLHRRS